MHLCHCHVDWSLRWEKSVWFYDPTERHREASYLTSNDALGIFWVFWSLVFILTEHTVCSRIRLSALTPKEQLHSVSLWITLALNWNFISCIHTFFLTNTRHIQWLCLRWLHGTSCSSLTSKLSQTVKSAALSPHCRNSDGLMKALTQPRHLLTCCTSNFLPNRIPKAKPTSF